MSLILETRLHRFRAQPAWDGPPRDHNLAIRYFRRRFDLDGRPERFLCRISADSRYKLFVNGTLLGHGPAKGALDHYFYETYDLAPHLRTGRNIIAAEVRWFGRNAPVSEVHSLVPAFLFEGPDGAGLDTPGSWEVLADSAVTPDTTPYIGNAHIFLNHWEHVDARQLPHGWLEGAATGADWRAARLVEGVEGNPGCGVFPEWTLHPRDIPLLTAEPRRFAAVVPNQSHRGQPAPGTITPWRCDSEPAKLVLDAGALTTGYPVFQFKGGKDRTVRITYAEAMGVWEEQGDRRYWRKGRRDDSVNGVPHGYVDTVILPGGDFTWEPFHWRTFWYLKLEVGPGEDPLVLENLHYRYATFPQHFEARFDCDDPDTRRFMEISRRTLELCAHETYEDCPYYEQLNYIADTRLQILCSYALANETRLARRTLRIYRDSLRPDGLTEARCPSREKQIIPYFSLLWILMLEDYWRQTGDNERDFVRSCLFPADGVLWFFRQRLRDTGTIGKVPKWNMVDSNPGWPGGEPPAIAAGESAYLTGLYVMALDAAIRLHREAGEASDADRWAPLAERLRLGLRQSAWSEQEGLFLEGPGRSDPLSQHTQCIAILADIATPEQTARILGRLTSDPSLLQMKFMQSFYLARALEKAGAYGPFWDHLLDRWREMLGNGVTTWQEYPDPTRSDCHAWSSWIAADFITTVLGIKVDRPRNRLVLAPQTEGRSRAEGAAPTPFGTIEVSWIKQDNRLSFTAEVPPGPEIVLRLPGRVEEVVAPGRIERTVALAD
ncbi:MAG: hypothetical protein EA425_12915 [Puniceicoccaceae bacterium]|nr:MAG: hypothetical protein EA425_12915 [Puniceicoccaceae bacterium]